MHLLKVGTASVNQTPLDWSGNFENIIEAIDAATAEGVQLLCLPELCITGYGCEDHFHSYEVQQEALHVLKAIAKDMEESGRNIKVCVGLPLLHNNALYNVVAVIDSGRILGFVPKQHLAGDGLHYEPRWFKPWPAGQAETTHVIDDEFFIPIGDMIFEFRHMGENSVVRVGFEICEDAWVANRPGAQLSQHGVDIMMNPSASHFAFGKYEVRQRFVMEGSRAFGTTYLYANLQGNEAGRAIYDGGNLIATRGGLVGYGRRFSFKPVELLTAVVDIDATRTQQSATASFTPKLGRYAVVPGYQALEASEQDASTAHTLHEDEAYDEFTNAISLALCDYMRKAHSKGFVISLSGGADSAACAVLVRKMWDIGVDTFGEETFLEHLGLEPGTVFKDILTCMYQSTRNSSDVTLDAATAVAKELGAKFLAVSVDSLVEGYKEMMSMALGRDLTWEKDDLALQNIQARVRAPSIWMVANIEGKLLITTSNRSEAAVGYCTMDGDTAGSIAPIGGIGKAFLLRWLRHTQLDFTSLGTVTRQKPTAELRPGASVQTDEDDLMPFEVLDAVEKEAIVGKKSPTDVYRVISRKYSKYTKEQCLLWVERFFLLWARNQWKRERFAPGFHVDEESLDPKTWCRFPILSGGFQIELTQLREYAKAEGVL